MEIRKLSLEEGARSAVGITVIIDVFRAFTLEAYLYGLGCEKIYAVAEVETAYQLKQKHPEYVLIGERDGKILPGFDYGNSPAVIKKVDWHHKTVIHTTSNGTRGIMNANHSAEILTGSFVNARAIAQYIEEKNPEVVSLVAMGWKERKTEEDELCADYIESLLQNHPLENIEQQLSDLRYSEGKKFFDPTQQDAFPQADFDECIALNQYDFVIRCEKEDDLIVNRRIEYA